MNKDIEDKQRIKNFQGIANEVQQSNSPALDLLAKASEEGRFDIGVGRIAVEVFVLKVVKRRRCHPIIVDVCVPLL